MQDNNKQKAFELVAPKSPEQIRQEASASAMPQARRAASQHRIGAAAKWLFCQITDDSFMFDFGGDGYGTVFTTVKALAKRYHHDRDSITKWLELLVKRGLVWCEHEWPYVVIHVAAVVQNPAHKASRNQRVRARSSAAQGRAEDTRTPFFVPKSVDSASKTDVSRTRVAKEPARDAEPTRTRSGKHPHMMRVEPARKGGRNPHTVPIEPAPHAGGFRTASGQHPHLGRVSSPVEGHSSQAGADKTRGGEVSEGRSLGDMEGGRRADAPVPPPNASPGNGDTDFSAWQAEMRQLFADKRERFEKEMNTGLEQAADDESRAFYRRRVAFLRDLRQGGRPPKRPTGGNGQPARAQSAPAAEISQEQLLTDAMGIVENAEAAGLKPLLTPKHRAALAKAGVTV